MSGEKKANKGLLRKCAKFAYMLSHKSKKNTLQNAHYVANFGTILSSFSGGQTAVSRIVISLCSGTPLVWSFFRSEWPRLVERFSLNDRYLGRLPKYITDTFNTRCAEHSLALCEQAHSFFFFFFFNFCPGSSWRRCRLSLQSIRRREQVRPRFFFCHSGN